MARNYKSRISADKLDFKIEQQKDTLAELIKMRNELGKDELMKAVLNSDKSYEEILEFVQGKDMGNENTTFRSE